MRNIAIVPARSGSKGLKDKNIKLLNGIPLMGYTIMVAKESKMFEEIMVSTDSEQYADIAISLGATVPFLRSKSNSGDLSGSWDVVVEVLDNYYREGKAFDTVCLLQPTSPLRNHMDIVEGYSNLLVKNADAITSVCEVDHSPKWYMTLPEDESMMEYRKTFTAERRQNMEQYYRINGAIYIRRIMYQDCRTILMSKREYAYVMDVNRSIDIDTAEDFMYAEWMMQRLGRKE